jgi:osmotically inducible protein OsmC
MSRELSSHAPLPSGHARGGIAVKMQVKIPTLPKDEAVTLVEETHEKICPYSHATRGNIDFSLEVEGAE